MRVATPLLAVLLLACGEIDPDEETETPSTTDPGTEPTDPTDTTDPTAPPVAEPDGDTLDDPLFEESFLGSGAPDLYVFEDAVSAAPGDPEDWIAFTTPAPENDDVSITLDLECEGTETIRVQLWDDDGASPLDLGASFSVSCTNPQDDFLLDVSHDYLARVYYPGGADAGDYTDWTLTVSW